MLAFSREKSHACCLKNPNFFQTSVVLRLKQAPFSAVRVASTLPSKTFLSLISWWSPLPLEKFLCLFQQIQTVYLEKFQKKTRIRQPETIETMCQTSENAKQQKK